MIYLHLIAQCHNIHSVPLQYPILSIVMHKNHAYDACTGVGVVVHRE